MKNNMKISASKVKKWKSCPKAFELRYLDKDAEPTKAEKGYKDLGSAVHDSIESILTQYPEMRDRESLIHLLKEEYRKIDPEISDFQEDTALECLEAAGKYIAKQGDIDIISVEDWVEFDINKNGVDEPAIAICDVIIERQNGSREIWDWKTGRIREETADEEIQQGVTYILAHMARYGTYPDKMNFIYLKEGKIRSREPSEEDFEEFFEATKDMLNGVKRGEYPADPEPSKCHFCDFEYFCPASDVSYSNINWEEY